MLKVLKFGGSSLADSSQFAKVKEIVKSDSSREVVIVSAPGKRNSDDNKITDPEEHPGASSMAGPRPKTPQLVSG